METYDCTLLTRYLRVEPTTTVGVVVVSLSLASYQYVFYFILALSGVTTALRCWGSKSQGHHTPLGWPGLLSTFLLVVCIFCLAVQAPVGLCAFLRALLVLHRFEVAHPPPPRPPQEINIPSYSIIDGRFCPFEGRGDETLTL